MRRRDIRCQGTALPTDYNRFTEVGLKILVKLSLSVLVPAAFVAAQTAPQSELPSAPSAVVQQQQQDQQQKEQQQREQAQREEAQKAAAPTPQPAKPPTPNAVAPSAPAVSPDPTKDDDDQPLTTIKKNVSEVNLVFTVTDKHGHFVKDLKKDDFKVLDDKKPPAAISNFGSETNLPLRVGLLVDASNSIRDRFRFEQDSNT